MRRTLFLFLCLASMAATIAQVKTVNDYYQCIKEMGAAPKEYILSLFDEADIVVLGERDHRDTTQYEFVLELLGDPRFVRKVGYVYTEVGVTNMTDKVNRLITAHYDSDQSFTDSLLAYNRQEDFYPMWEKYNRLQFLRGLYEINRDSRRNVVLGLTDCAFSWDEIRTPEQYSDFYYSPACEYRDSTMTANFIRMYNAQKPRRGKRKALIITNLPHAVNAKMKNREYYRQGWWLKQHFGEENVKIVAFNWKDYRARGEQTQLTGGGLWDAAFELADTQPFALDLQGTPYGTTPYIDPSYGNLQWQDVADGLIYYTPIYEQKLTIGFSQDIAPDEFKEELFRRTNIYREAVDQDFPNLTAEEIQKLYNRFFTLPATYPESPEAVRERIRKLME